MSPFPIRALVPSLGVGAILLLGISISSGCQSPSAAEGPEARPLGSLEIEPVRVPAVVTQRSDLVLSAEATGHLEAVRQVDIKTEQGGRVARLLVREGDWVEAGQVLFRLDDREAHIALEEAEAELLSAQASYAVFYQEESEESAPASPSSPESVAATEEEGTTVDSLARAKELLEDGLISRQKFDQMRRNLEVQSLLTGERRREVQAVRSGVLQAEQRLERARLALDRTRARAPFSGRVSTILVEVGQQLGSGETCLTILDDSRLTVDVRVLDASMVRLETGARARVRVPALDQTEIEGTVCSIEPRIDPATGTGQVTVLLPNADRRLMPGLFALIELETSVLVDRLMVPEEAVLDRDGRELVFRIEGDQALWEYVETGVRTRDRVEILDGLNEGDLVAVDNHFTLAHQAVVEPEIRSE